MNIIVELEGSQLTVQGIEYNFVFKVDMINASNFVHDDLLMQELIFVVMINAVPSMIFFMKLIFNTYYLCKKVIEIYIIRNY